jgi:hypothetical protein
MQRWWSLLGLALLSLILIAYALPFHAYVIELQADGSSLGEIPGEVIRFIGLAIGSVPLVILAALALFSRRFRAWAIPCKFTGSAMIIGTLILGLFLRSLD